MPVLRPISTSPIDFDPELIRITTSFRPSQRLPQTPKPHRRPSVDDDDSDAMERSHSTNGTKADSRKPKAVNESTQSDEKTTRTVGTMHEPVQTRNFGNEVQPQSSATQTSFSLKERPSRPPKTFIERAEHPRSPVNDHYPDPRTSIRTPQPYRDESPYYSVDRIPDASLRRRSPSPVRTTVYRYDPYYREHSPYRHSPYRSRSPSPAPRQPTRRRRRRPQMRSQETDTTLDAMRRQQHAGVQYDPRSTQEKGTTPSLRTRRPTSSHRPLPTNISLHSTLPRFHERPPSTYHIPATTHRRHYHERQDEEEEEYDDDDDLPSMHDKSTMAELVTSFDHYTQYDAQPYMADRHIQTTPTVDDDGLRHALERAEETYIRQLPRRNSTYIPYQLFVQPDTLPRPRRSHHSPVRSRREGLDYTGNILEVSLHHGHQQRMTDASDSPVLHIGTEHVLPQTSTNEFTVPFETRYIHDSFSRSRNSSPFMWSAFESIRSRLSTRSPVRQSISNGNFYLSTAPTRSLNSSFRVDITAGDF